MGLFGSEEKSLWARSVLEAMVVETVFSAGKSLTFLLMAVIFPPNLFFRYFSLINTSNFLILLVKLAFFNCMNLGMYYLTVCCF